MKKTAVLLLVFVVACAASYHSGQVEGEGSARAYFKKQFPAIVHHAAQAGYECCQHGVSTNAMHQSLDEQFNAVDARHSDR
jgi:hypothetical protein